MWGSPFSRRILSLDNDEGYYEPQGGDNINSPGNWNTVWSGGGLDKWDHNIEHVVPFVAVAFLENPSAAGYWAGSWDFHIE